MNKNTTKNQLSLINNHINTQGKIKGTEVTLLREPSQTVGVSTGHRASDPWEIYKTDSVGNPIGKPIGEVCPD